ncbi:stage III sporulation protein AD [Oceanirhabdus sp. W0125-5]|uniref:stage III sporulation protein AD n=1 Tax=Oceanirhabdus sp. W0125-5 TaxID=2999116 RepID=UPI0022F2A9DD|nr:stage III sporulation protein AD [Oceanirhabdus sp. W0125-5]WBW95332.1 stage III sporulation protein AD [Oceanirhabdus sp. W0125-5]
MEILKIISLAFIAMILYLSLKDEKKELAYFILLASGIIIIIFIVPKMKAIVLFLETVSIKTGVDIIYLNTIFKILGIAYLTTFCTELCKDAGASSLASKVEVAGKVIILSLGVPILMAVLKSIVSIISA